MPKSITKLSLKIDPLSLRSKPELTAYIGIISTHWADIENELALLFALAVRTEPAIATAILGCVANLTTRLSMISTAISLSYGPKEGKRFNRELLQLLRHAAAKRNRIVHALWTTHENYPDGLIRTDGLIDPLLRSEVFYEADFARCVRDLLTVHLSLKRYGQSLAALAPTGKPQQSFWQVDMPDQDQLAAPVGTGRKHRPSSKQ